MSHVYSRSVQSSSKCYDSKLRICYRIQYVTYGTENYSLPMVQYATTLHGTVYMKSCMIKSCMIHWYIGPIYVWHYPILFQYFTSIRSFSILSKIWIVNKHNIWEEFVYLWFCKEPSVFCNICQVSSIKFNDVNLRHYY